MILLVNWKRYAWAFYSWVVALSQNGNSAAHSALKKRLGWIHTNNASVFSSLSRMRVFIFSTLQTKTGMQKSEMRMRQCDKKRLRSSMNSALAFKCESSSKQQNK